MGEVQGQQPEQHQAGPGTTAEMDPKPQDEVTATGRRAVLLPGELADEEHATGIVERTVNGLRGNKSLLDYSATKGTVLSFTYSLAQNLVEKRIRVNAVAPGPVWAPLIPAYDTGEVLAPIGGETFPG